MTNFSRRTFLKAAAVTTVGAGALSTSVAAHEAPVTQPILCEVDMDGKFDIENHRVDDPAADFCDYDEYTERENLLHVTTNGHETRDYSSGIVNLQDRLDYTLTLGKAAANTVGYAYFQGPKSENAAPDELFLIVRDADAKSDEKGLHAVYKTINDGVDPESKADSCESGWRGVDVSAQITGDGNGDRDWAAIDITKDDVASGEMVIETAQSLRDDEDRFDSVIDEFGSDAELVAVGYGTGFTTQETVVDIYYDQLVVRREHDDEIVRDTFDFPATIPMDVEFEGPHDGTLTATLTPQQEEVSLDLDDVLEDSVKLTRYVPVAPPVEEGGSASSVTVSDGEIVAEFPASEVGGILGGEEPVLVSGWFDNEAGDAFVAQASSVRDKGGGHHSASLHL